jgi:Beta-1,3-glucanase
MVRSAFSSARLGVSLLPILLVACSGTDSTTPATDSGTPATDAGTTAADTGIATTAPDAATTGADAGNESPTDASTDHGTIPADAGTTGPTGSSTGLLVQVTNSCPVDVWIHGTGQEGTLSPDNVHLVPGASQQYNAPLTWTAARIYAYLEAPDSSGNPQGQNDKVEMNFGTSGGVESMNTDVTYVDWLALPSRIQAIGTGSGCSTVGCEVPYSQVLDGCPPSLLSGHECLSAGSYCLSSSNVADPFCHLLDSQIPACASEYSDCAGATGATTAEVYSCSGTFFSQSPEYCAALNRGVLGQPGSSTPPSAFYASPPFDQYSAWVHETCPGIYAFPYDDYGSSNQSSDETCSGATQLNITFCPQG